MKKEIKLRDELKKTLVIIKKRKFTGYRGIAIKNGLFQFLSNIVTKLGGLLLTIILARILMPELYGLYALTLTIVGIFLTLADSGINSTLIRYASFYLGKNKKKIARSYAGFLFKIKIFLALIFSLLLIILAFPLQNFFNKEIGLALIFSSIYLFIFSIAGFFFAFFPTLNKFEYTFAKETIFQFSRVILAGLTAFYVIKYITQNPNVVLPSLIIVLALSCFFALIFSFVLIKKKYSFLLPSLKASVKEKREVLSFILSLTFVAISSVFFAQIDTLMLGKFVDAEWLGYYRIAFSLFFGVVGLLNLTAVFYPIFSRVAKQKEKLDYMLKRANLLLFLIAISGFVLLELFAYPAVLLLFGKHYLPSLTLLRVISLLIFSALIIPNYIFYFSAIKKPQAVAKILFVSMLLNIVLNYLFITWLIKYGQQQATIGAALATLLSRYFYLACLMGYKKFLINRK